MNLGSRIKKSRVLQKLTQKELGVLIGFSESNADVRIAQYETGSRIPKDDILIELAKVLDVNIEYFKAPNVESIEDVMRTLFAIEEQYIVDFELVDDKDTREYKKAFINVAYLDVEFFIKEWSSKHYAMKKGEITESEYFKWKANWPKSSEMYQVIYQDLE